MAREWIKIRDDLLTSHKTFALAASVGLPKEAVFVRLYTLAAWFHTHGNYGKMQCTPEVIDAIAECNGFANAMLKFGFAKREGEFIFLCWFTTVSTTRKGLGSKLRREVLASGKCAACGTTEGMIVIDHIVPISRGGTSDRSNLQPLCFGCNASKGRRTMEEFTRDR